MLPNEILINIFEYCDPSCLYSLLLVSKRVKKLIKLVFGKSKILVSLEYSTKGTGFSINVFSKEYRFILKEDYILMKNKNLKTNIYVDSGKFWKTMYVDVIMKKVENLNLIRGIMEEGIENINSGCKMDINIEW